MRSLAVLVAALAVACAPASAAPAAAPDRGLERLETLETAVLLELNRSRSARGLRALRTTPGLRSAAASHSHAMLELGFFRHDSADGTSFVNRLRRSYSHRGWDTWSVAETLVAGSPAMDARDVVAAWIGSPSHRAIILAAGWRDTGIGAMFTPVAPGDFGGTATVVVTADFGVRAGRARPSGGRS